MSISSGRRWRVAAAAALGVAFLATAALAAPVGAASAPTCKADQLNIIYVRTTTAMGTKAAEYGFENTSMHSCTLTGYPTAQLLTASGRKLAPRSTHATGAFGITVKPVELRTGAIAYFAVIYHSQTGFGQETCPASATLELTAPNTVSALTVKGAAGEIAAYSGTQLKLTCGLLRVSPVTAKRFQ